MTLSEVLNIIINNVSDDKALRECHVESFKVISCERAVYKNSKEYSGLIYELIFLVDMGDWFSKTIRFELSIDESDRFIRYKKNYDDHHVKYGEADYKLVTKEIIDSIQDFSRKYIPN